MSQGQSRGLSLLFGAVAVLVLVPAAILAEVARLKAKCLAL